MEENKQPVKMLYRSNTNRVIFGVCGGLGEYFEVDPVIFRIIFILLTIGAGSGILLYLVMALLIPKNNSVESGHINVKDRAHELAGELKDLKSSRTHRRNPVLRLLLGVLMITLGFSFLVQNFNLVPGFHMYFYKVWAFWPLIIILIGLSILLKEIEK